MRIRRSKILISAIGLLLGSVSIYFACAEAEPPLEYAAAEHVARISIRELHESSGLAASRVDPNLLWSHNDSGDGARLFAFDTSGANLGVCDVQGAKALDWEDMASFEKGGNPFLLVADTGDNSRSRKTYRLYRIPERRPELGALAVDQVVTFRFEHGACDCEAIAYDATLDQVVLIDKGWNLRCRVFTLDWPKANKSASPVIAKQAAVLKIAGITSLDISPDGRRAIALTYGPAYEFVREANETWRDAFSREGREIRMPMRRQGEAICYGFDGKVLFLTSEKYPTPLFRVPIADEQAKKLDVGADTSSAITDSPP